MGRRSRKKKTQIFSTSLLDMLFCAFGGMYTLFVIGTALFTTVSISLPVLITAQLDFTSIATLEDYKTNSYLAFGVDDNYENETETDTSINVHYGYVHSNFSENKTRKIQGQQYINDTSSFRITLKELYDNQLPSNKSFFVPMDHEEVAIKHLYSNIGQGVSIGQLIRNDVAVLDAIRSRCIEFEDTVNIKLFPFEKGYEIADSVKIGFVNSVEFVARAIKHLSYEGSAINGNLMLFLW